MPSTAEHPDTLLVVEDNHGDVRLIEEAVRNSSLEAELHDVATGEEALQFVGQRGEYADAPRPDVVLFDLNLPETDEKRTLDRLTDEFPDISVIAMTGGRRQTDDVHTISSHADEYLRKPTDPQGYVDAIRSV